MSPRLVWPPLGLANDLWSVAWIRGEAQSTHLHAKPRGGRMAAVGCLGSVPACAVPRPAGAWPRTSQRWQAIKLRSWEQSPVIRSATSPLVKREAQCCSDPGRTRTCNLWFRRPTPYPLGHRTRQLACMRFLEPCCHVVVCSAGCSGPPDWR